VNGKNPKVKKCPKTDHHIAARVLDLSFFLKTNKRMNRKPQPMRWKELLEILTSYNKQTVFFYNLRKPQSMLYPLSLYPPNPSIIMQKRHQKQTGADHPLHQFKHLLSNKINFLCLQDFLSLSISLFFFLFTCYL